MTVYNASGFHGDTAAGTATTVLLASPGAGTFLTRVDVQGYIRYVQGGASITTGQYDDYDLAAGVQMGNAGYGGVALSTGSAAGATWIQYGNLLTPAIRDKYLVGTSPQNYMDDLGYAVNVSVRKYVWLLNATDVYLALGGDHSQSYMQSFKAYFTWYVEWCSYP